MKKPMSKRVIAAVTAAAMTMSLAACGGGAEPAQPAPADTQPETKEEAPAQEAAPVPAQPATPAPAPVQEGPAPVQQAANETAQEATSLADAAKAAEEALNSGAQNE